MPLHDWTRVPSGLFHHFHQFWAMEICRKLNRGRLPRGLSALVEQRSGPKETDVLTVELAAPDESAQGGTAVLERPKTRIHRHTDKAYYADKADRITIRHHLGASWPSSKSSRQGTKTGIGRWNSLSPRLPTPCNRASTFWCSISFHLQSAIRREFTRQFGISSIVRTSSCRPIRIGYSHRTNLLASKVHTSRRSVLAISFRTCRSSSPLALMFWCRWKRPT